MAAPTAVGEYGSCQGTETRVSVSDTSGTVVPAGGSSAVASTTKNLRLAYATVGSSGTTDTCAVVAAQII
jgi:hypothetical protein